MPQALADLDEPLNILYYGDGGTGKTTALAGMAHLGKVLIINAESGVKKRPLADRGIPVKNIQVFPAKGEELSLGALEELWLTLREKGGYVGVAWDSVTEMYKALLDSVVAGAVVKAEKRGIERDRFFIDRADYGVMTEQVRSLVRKYRDLPMHFGMSALARREQDDDSSVAYQPAVTPALQNDLVGWVDVVCHTSVALVDGEEEYRGLFRPHGKYRGKDRTGGLPKWLVDPAFERVLAYTKGELEEAKDAVMVAARKRAESAKDNGSGTQAAKETAAA